MSISLNLKDPIDTTAIHSQIIYKGYPDTLKLKLVCQIDIFALKQTIVVSLFYTVT